MARTTAPLLGFEASGALGETLVYAKWRGVRYARRYVKPANPKTAAQTTTRVTFSLLREMWKRMDSVARTPWDAFAAGRKFLGLNAFIGENMRVLRGDVILDDFLASPGAKGGISPATVLIAQGTTTGTVDITITTPTLPTGWTYLKGEAVALPDQSTQVDLVGPIVSAQAGAENTLFTIAGFATVQPVVVGAWLTLTKPNGEIAYSVGTTLKVNAGV